MKLSTEKEKLTYQQSQLYKLANAYKKDPNLFKEICSYFSFAIYINKVDSLDSVYINHDSQTVMEYHESIDITTKGYTHIKSISDQRALANYIIKVRKFNERNDPCEICTYLQRFMVRGEMTWLPTFKMFLNNDLYLNILYPITEFGKIGSLLENTLGETFIKRNGWEIFSSLTKREKEILKLLAAGYTSKQISEEIYIAKTTADSYRRDIFNKLGVKTYAQLFKFAQAFELIEDL